MKRIIVIDTSVLCCWLKIPGMGEVGPDNDKWDFDRINTLIEQETEDGSLCVLPMATLIETGNHIAKAAHSRRELAQKFCELLEASVKAKSPWAAFRDQNAMWEDAMILSLAAEWPDLAARKVSIGDATIRNVAEYYAKGGYSVEIITGDQGLQGFEPPAPAKRPRRR